jgi:hypothetical protein
MASVGVLEQDFPESNLITADHVRNKNGFPGIYLIAPAWF